nr:unnamed protein product [Callosobruchus chinensis]
MSYVVCTYLSKLRLPLRQSVWLFSNITKPSNSSFLCRPTIDFTTRRSLFRFVKRPKKEELKIKDNIPDQYKLIYRNPMHRYIWFAQVITSATAVIVGLVTIIKTDFVRYEDAFQTPEISGEAIVYMASFIAVLVVLQLMIHRIPIRIYYLPQQKNYIMIFFGSHPFTSRRVICKAGDVVQLPIATLVPWKESSFEIKNKQKVILFDEYFRRPGDLHVLLGIQDDPDADNPDDKDI